MESNGRSMNSFSRLKHEWKNAGIMERASWVIGFGVPIMGGVVWFYGIIEKSNIFILLSLIFFLLSLVAIFLNISMRHQRDDLKQTYQSERVRFEKEISGWREHHAKLLKYLGEENKKRQSERMAVYTRTDGNIQSVSYGMDAIFDITTPGDTLFGEENEWAKNRMNKAHDSGLANASP